MSVASTTYKCDYPRCPVTITVPSDDLFNDLRWERRSFVNFNPLYHVCPDHRFVDSRELERLIDAAEWEEVKT